MKKLFLFIAFFFACFNIINSQTVDWAVSEPHKSYVTRTNVVLNDNVGNIFISSQCDNGLLIVKYNQNGNKLWEKNYLGYGEVTSLCIDGFGYLYTVIEIGKIIIDSIEYASNTGNGGGFLFIKYDAFGDKIWLKQMKPCMVLSKKTDTQNNIIVTGRFGSNVYLENGCTLYLSSNPMDNIFIAKFNLNGECIWAIQGEGDYGNPLIIDKPDKMYATGELYGQTLTLGKAGKQVILYESNGKFYCAKYDSNGELLWAKQPQTSHLAPDEFGNCYTFPMDTLVYGPLHHYVDGYIIKYDTAGNLLWERTHFYIDKIYRTQMTCGSNGDLFISGGFRNFMTIDDTTLYSYGNNLYRTFIAKSDSSGTLKWLITSSGSGASGAKDITVKGNEIFVTGDMWGEVSFGNYTVNQPSGGVFTIKITDNDIAADVTASIKTSYEFDVYPNPFANDFYIKIFLPVKDALEITIYDVNGKVVYTEKLKEFVGEMNKKIELGECTGVYFVEAAGDRKRSVKRIILN